MEEKKTYHINKELEKLLSILPGQTLDIEVVKAAFLDHDTVAVLVADDDGNYLYVNQATVNLFGYSEKEFMLMNIRDIRMVDGANPIKLYKSFVNKGILGGVFHFYDSSDQIKIGLYRATKIADDVNLSLMFDVTEQFSYFDDLIDQLNNQSDVLNNIPSITFRYLHRKEGPSMFTFVSDNVAKVLRLQNQKAPMEWSVGELVIDEDLPAFMEASMKAIAEVKPLVHQARLTLGDGTVSPFEVRSYPVERNGDIIFYGTLYLL
jgi:transcriptional regulator with PAS, ATPase and Fis domain